MTMEFTKSQAGRWVAQEFAKHPTAESAAERIASEKRFARLYAAACLPKMPNNEWARKRLIQCLTGVVLDALTAEYEEWLADKPADWKMSADELLLEYDHNGADREWLIDFIARWEAAEGTY